MHTILCNIIFCILLLSAFYVKAMDVDRPNQRVDRVGQLTALMQKAEQAPSMNDQNVLALLSSSLAPEEYKKVCKPTELYRLPGQTYFSPDGRCVATHVDDSIIVQDAYTGKIQQRIQSGEVAELLWSNGGNYIVDRRGYPNPGYFKHRIWAVSDGSLIPYPNDLGHLLCFSPKDRYVRMANALIELLTGRVIFDFENQIDDKCEFSNSEKYAAIRTSQVLPGKLVKRIITGGVISVSTEKRITTMRVLSLSDGTEIAHFDYEESYPYSLNLKYEVDGDFAFSPNSDLLYITSTEQNNDVWGLIESNNKLDAYDPATGRKKTIFKECGDPGFHIEKVSSDDSKIGLRYPASRRRIIVDTKSGKVVFKFKKKSGCLDRELDPRMNYFLRDSDYSTKTYKLEDFSGKTVDLEIPLFSGAAGTFSKKGMFVLFQLPKQLVLYNLATKTRFCFDSPKIKGYLDEIQQRIHQSETMALVRSMDGRTDRVVELLSLHNTPLKEILALKILRNNLNQNTTLCPHALSIAGKSSNEFLRTYAYRVLLICRGPTNPESQLMTITNEQEKDSTSSTRPKESIKPGSPEFRGLLYNFTKANAVDISLIHELGDIRKEADKPMIYNNVWGPLLYDHFEVIKHRLNLLTKQLCSDGLKHEIFLLSSSYPAYQKFRSESPLNLLEEMAVVVVYNNLKSYSSVDPIALEILKQSKWEFLQKIGDICEKFWGSESNKLRKCHDQLLGEVYKALLYMSNQEVEKRVEQYKSEDPDKWKWIYFWALRWRDKSVVDFIATKIPENKRDGIVAQANHLLKRFLLLSVNE